MSGQGEFAPKRMACFEGAYRPGTLYRQPRTDAKPTRRELGRIECLECGWSGTRDQLRQPRGARPERGYEALGSSGPRFPGCPVCRTDRDLVEAVVDVS